MLVFLLQGESSAVWAADAAGDEYALYLPRRPTTRTISHISNLLLSLSFVSLLHETSTASVVLDFPGPGCSILHTPVRTVSKTNPLVKENRVTNNNPYLLHTLDADFRDLLKSLPIPQLTMHLRILSNEDSQEVT